MEIEEKISEMKLHRMATQAINKIGITNSMCEPVGIQQIGLLHTIFSVSPMN